MRFLGLLELEPSGITDELHRCYRITDELCIVNCNAKSLPWIFILLDLPATFDTTNHYLCLETCSSLGFQNILLMLIISSQVHCLTSLWILRFNPETPSLRNDQTDLSQSHGFKYHLHTDDPQISVSNLVPSQLQPHISKGLLDNSTWISNRHITLFF